MKNPSPLEVLSAELGAVAGRIERESALKIRAAISDLKRESAERELRFANLEKALLEKVDARLAAVKDGRDGIDGQNGKDGADGRDGKDGVNGIDGKSFGVEDIRPMFAEIAERAAALLPLPKDGRDGIDGKSFTIEDVLPAINAEIEKRVSAIPVPKDGKDGLNGKDGIDGRDGKLPLVRSWEDKVHREGEVISFDGGTYQALRDTGKQPTHADWICLAAPGKNGMDGRSITIRGTYNADENYSALDQVTLNGASFTAKKDNPGACPGEGWQLSSAQGKTGRPGEPGKSIKGDPGKAAVVVKGHVDEQGLLTLENSDGSTVEVDFYPVLSKVS